MFFAWSTRPANITAMPGRKPAREQPSARIMSHLVTRAKNVAARGDVHDAADLAQFLAPTAGDPQAMLLIGVRSALCLEDGERILRLAHQLPKRLLWVEGVAHWRLRDARHAEQLLSKRLEELAVFLWSERRLDEAEACHAEPRLAADAGGTAERCAQRLPRCARAGDLAGRRLCRRGQSRVVLASARYSVIVSGSAGKCSRPKGAQKAEKSRQSARASSAARQAWARRSSSVAVSSAWRTASGAASGSRSPEGRTPERSRPPAHFQPAQVSLGLEDLASAGSSLGKRVCQGRCGYPLKSLGLSSSMNFLKRVVSSASAFLSATNSSSSILSET